MRNNNFSNTDGRENLNYLIINVSVVTSITLLLHVGMLRLQVRTRTHVCNHRFNNE